MKVVKHRHRRKVSLAHLEKNQFGMKPNGSEVFQVVEHRDRIVHVRYLHTGSTWNFDPGLIVIPVKITEVAEIYDRRDPLVEVTMQVRKSQLREVRDLWDNAKWREIE
jgi:hypothetical protein